MSGQFHSQLLELSHFVAGQDWGSQVQLLSSLTKEPTYLALYLVPVSVLLWFKPVW